MCNLIYFPYSLWTWTLTISRWPTMKCQWMLLQPFGSIICNRPVVHCWRSVCRGRSRLRERQHQPTPSWKGLQWCVCVCVCVHVCVCVCIHNLAGGYVRGSKKFRGTKFSLLFWPHGANLWGRGELDMTVHIFLCTYACMYCGTPLFQTIESHIYTPLV